MIGRSFPPNNGPYLIPYFAPLAKDHIRRPSWWRCVKDMGWDGKTVLDFFPWCSLYNSYSSRYLMAGFQLLMCTGSQPLPPPPFLVLTSVKPHQGKCYDFGARSSYNHHPVVCNHRTPARESPSLVLRPLPLKKLFVCFVFTIILFPPSLSHFLSACKSLLHHKLNNDQWVRPGIEAAMHRQLLHWTTHWKLHMVFNLLFLKLI